MGTVILLAVIVAMAVMAYMSQKIYQNVLCDKCPLRQKCEERVSNGGISFCEENQILNHNNYQL